MKGGLGKGNVFDLLEDLPRVSLDRLYGLEGHALTAAAEAAAGEKPLKKSATGGGQGPHPWTCRAVFQSLPALAKQYVMRLICVDHPVSKTHVIGKWTLPDHSTKLVHDAALDKLDKLRILVPDTNDSDQLQLNPHFRHNLLAALTGNQTSPWSDAAVVLKPGADRPTTTSLESYMCAKWNGVLHYLVGTSDSGFDEPADEVKRFLMDTDLMRKVAGVKGGVAMTNHGIEFLLKDVHVQVWLFVEYILRHEEKGRDDILTFLFQLSYCRVGEAYSVRALTDVQQKLLTKFSSFGLILLDKPSAVFYPTDVAVNLIFGALTTPPPPAASSMRQEISRELRLLDPKQLSIIVETNYQVLVYTELSLHIEMVKKFVAMRYRMANMAVGFITRNSIRRALAQGITAATIINFLKAHAHPVVRKRPPLIPENVEEQIILWNRERSRIKCDESVLMDLTQDRLSEEHFKAIKKYAQDQKFLLWASESGVDRKMLVVQSNSLDRMRDFIESRR